MSDIPIADSRIAKIREYAGNRRGLGRHNEIRDENENRAKKLLAQIQLGYQEAGNILVRYEEQIWDLLKEYDRLTAELKAMKFERELNVDCCANTAQNAVESAMRGMFEVFTNEEEEEIQGADATDGLVCRIKRFSDSGDSSTGIPGREYWCLETDQSGTLLANLLAELASLRKEREWIPVSEWKAVHGIRVLVTAWHNHWVERAPSFERVDNWKPLVLRAVWFDSSDGMDYEGDEDDFIPGWYEESDTGETVHRITEKISHVMALPTPPSPEQL